jgi:hypothetical protein
VAEISAAAKKVVQGPALSAGGAVPGAPAAPPRPAPPVERRERPASPRGPAPSIGTGVVLKAGERKMLAAFVQFAPAGGTLTRTQLSILAGLRGGTFDRYLSTLRGAGYVSSNGPGDLAITPAGQEYVVAAGMHRPPSREDLIGMWMAKLKAGERTMLEVLLAHPRGLPRDELEQQADYHGGTFDRYLSTLKGAGLAVWDGGVLKPAAELVG